MHLVSSNCVQDVKDKLEISALNIMNYFASNELVANPTKTAFRPTKIVGEKLRVKKGDAIINESMTERALGVKVQRSLEFDDQTDIVISKMNHGLSILQQVQGTVRRDNIRRSGYVSFKIWYKCIPRHTIPKASASAQMNTFPITLPDYK